MNTLSYKTISANPSTIQQDWLIIDAANQTLGRLATQVAVLLRGKHKTYYTPHMDCGDKVIVVNAEQIKLTGNKWDQKLYTRHSLYPGGQTRTLAKNVMQKKPTFMVEKAIKNMLPKNRLGAAMYRSLYVYQGAEHPHEAQQPKLFKLLAQ